MRLQEVQACMLFLPADMLFRVSGTHKPEGGMNQGLPNRCIYLAGNSFRIQQVLFHRLR